MEIKQYTHILKAISPRIAIYQDIPDTINSCENYSGLK